MAFGRRKTREDSTTAAGGVGPTPAVVKSPRASRKPKPDPKPAEIVEQTTLDPEVEQQVRDDYRGGRTYPPASHDDEW